MTLDLSRGVILEAPKPGAPKVWYWINFHEPTVAARFLGAAIVHAADPASAIQEAWRLKINPGGSPYFHPLEDWATPPRTWRNRLLVQSECDRLNANFAERLAVGGALTGMFGSMVGFGIHPAGDCDLCTDPDFGFDRHVWRDQ